MKCLSIPALAALALGAMPTLGQNQEQEEAPRGLLLSDEGAFDGYTLFSPISSTTVFLLDMRGEVVHRWETEIQGARVHLFDDGNLLRLGSHDDHPRFQGPGVEGGLIQELDWDGNELWRYVLADDYQLFHHDAALLPNGNLLLIAWEHRYREDAIEWGRDADQVGEAGLWPDAVLEIRPTRPEGAEIVWEWHVWDHVIQDRDPARTNFGSVPDRPGRIDINAEHRDRPPLTAEEQEQLEELERQMAALGYGGAAEEAGDGGAGRTGHAPDWLHTNSIDYHPEYDLIVLSTPHMNELWVIDHSTTTEQAARGSGGRWGKGGDLLWRWGNPRNYDAGDDADQRLFYQHHATWLSGEDSGELRLLVFNNGGGRPGGDFSSIDELVLPFDPERGFVRAEGRPFGPEAPLRSYSAPGEFFSPFISGTQRLPNGNTLICSGVPGRIFEVTRDGRIVWDYLNPYGGEVSFPNAPPAKSLYALS